MEEGNLMTYWIAYLDIINSSSCHVVNIDSNRSTFCHYNKKTHMGG